MPALLRSEPLRWGRFGRLNGSVDSRRTPAPEPMYQPPRRLARRRHRWLTSWQENCAAMWFGIGCFFPGRKSCECVIRGWMKLIRCRQRWLGRDSSQTLSCIKLSSYDIPWSGYGQFLKSFLEEKFDSEIRVWVWSTLHKRLKTTFSRRIIYYILYMSYWKNTLLQMASVEETALAWFGFETNKLFA